MNRKSDIVIITGDKNEISQLEIKLSSIVKNLVSNFRSCKSQSNPSISFIC